MSIAGKFIDNSMKMLAKPVAMAAMLLSPLMGKAQTQSNLHDGRLWALTIDGVFTSTDPGSTKKFDTNFGVHGTVPGFGDEDTFVGEHNWLVGGGRTAGRTLHGAVRTEGPGHRGFYGWSQKFGVAYLGWMIGQQVKLGERSRGLIGFENTANCFIGGANNTLNFAHYTGALKAQANIAILKMNGGALGLELSIAKDLYQVRNKSIYNQYLTEEFGDNSRGLATQEQINPGFIAKAGISFTFNK